MLGENWNVVSANVDTAKEKTLASSLGTGRLLARVLGARGYSEPEAALRFIEKKDLKLYDPFLMKDMDKACARIGRAIKEHEPVCIYGDYDVDGVTSTTVLCLYLKSKGVDVTTYIPERLSEGFGLNKGAIKKISECARLIITVDTGITATEETKYAKELGLDVVITDHHSCRDIIPDCEAVVNPRREDCEYPFKSLAGVGVVFKLLCALEGDGEAILDKYADLVAIGTIADVMPIADENRLIVDRGLAMLAHTDRVGLAALLDSAGIRPDKGKRKVSTSTVGFAIAPRLNAAGRIASAGKSLELLMAEDYGVAIELADELCEINKIRQSTEQTIFDEASKQISVRKSGRRFSYILSSDNWHQGVVGVVASKISEKYSLPVILFSFDGDVGKGSGRSVKGLNLTAILEACSDLLLEYGGHELAAGLSIERKNLSEFERRFEELSRKKSEGKDLAPSVDIDCEIGFDEINVQNYDELQRMEPFGLSNPVPTFILKNAVVCDVTPMSSDKHIRVRLKNADGSGEAGAVLFGLSHREFPFCAGDMCDVACTLGINEYRGLIYPQLFIKAVRPCEKEARLINESRDIYNHASDPEDMDSLPQRVIPTVEDFRTAYRVLHREIGNERKRISVRYLKRKVEQTEGTEINLCALRIILDVMEEFSVADISHSGGSDIIEIELVPHAQKVDLDKSVILRAIRKRTI